MKKVLCALLGVLWILPSWANETCRNLYNPSYIYTPDFELVDGNILRNKKTDNRQNAQLNFYVQYEGGGHNVLAVITSPGEYTAKFTVPDADTPIGFYHSGTSINLTFYTGQKLTPGSYVVSIKVLGTDSRVVGGLQIQDIKIYPAECYDIKIATTKYVESEFAPMVSALQSAISVVDSVVSRTITQAASIATLQSGKQTRPADDTCPAYKQCLLVEDEQGVPHWYQITDPFRDFVAPIIANNVAPASTTAQPGYQQVAWLSGDGSALIDTGIVFNDGSMKFQAEVYWTYRTAETDFIGNFGGGGFVAGQYSQGLAFLYVNPSNVNSRGILNEWNVFGGECDSTTCSMTFNGETKLLENRSTQQNNRGIALFSGSVSGYNTASNDTRLRNVKIWRNGTLVRNFHPVRRLSDSALGMYDTVTKTFFTNAGTGTFTEGPTVANTDVPANQTWTATWTANASNGVTAGTVYGEGVCNAVTGTANTAATSAQMSSANWSASGAECWCKVSGLTVGEEYNAAPSSISWISLPTNNTAAYCATSCAALCAYNARRDDASFRKALFGM